MLSPRESMVLGFVTNEVLMKQVQENRQRIERAKYIEPDASDLP